METKTADLDDAREFAEAIHAVYPDQMLAYNLSPSFNWDTTGMTDEEMRAFPEELGKMGFVFNFITYGGHQIDGLAAEEFTTALREDGMLALARLQRKFRLLESPYRTPQTLVGGPRADAALASASGQTAMTKAMGEGSTQSQHLVQTEVPPKVLEGWLADWAEHHGVDTALKVSLRPHTAGSSELLELSVVDDDDEKLANIVFATLQDRRGRSILSVRDQNTFDRSLRRKRLMTLLHLFLIHRYKAQAIHYLTPTEDNHRAAASMKRLGIFESTNEEVGEIIVAEVNGDAVAALVQGGGRAGEADHQDGLTPRRAGPLGAARGERARAGRASARGGALHSRRLRSRRGRRRAARGSARRSCSPTAASCAAASPHLQQAPLEQALLVGGALGGGDHLEAPVGDGLAADDADAVGALGEALLGPLHGRQILAQLLDAAEVALEVRQVGGAVAVVGVVGEPLGRVGLELGVEPPQLVLDPAALGRQQLRCAGGVHQSVVRDSRSPRYG